MLFVTFCTEMGAAYGSVEDESGTETLLTALGIPVAEWGPRLEQICKRVEEGRPPEFLWWCQFFGTEYLVRLDWPVLLDGGGKIQFVPGGALLSFFEAPWAINWHELVAINKRWQQHLAGVN